jgi:hypothetical protein
VARKPKITESEWLIGTDPMPMLRRIQKGGSARKMRLLAVMPARLRWAEIPEKPFREAIETAERHADGRATDDELAAYREQLYGYVGSQFPDWISQETNRVVHSLAFTTTYKPPLRPLVPGGTWTFCASLVGEALCPIIRDIFGNPFRPVTFSPAWRTDTAVALARQMYDAREFGAMPILADALQDAGCEDEQILSHCLSDGAHVRGCWVVDLVLGKV